MGNDTSKKDPNKGRATFQVLDYNLNKAKMPDNMKNRIDEFMWKEFTDLIVTASEVGDREKCKKADTLFMVSFFSAFFGIIGGAVCAGLSGGLAEDGLGAGNIIGILIGILIFIASIVCFFVGPMIASNAQKEFYLVVRKAIDDALSTLNLKYKNMIYFTLFGDRLAQGDIHIDFELKIQKIQHISGNSVMMQPQPQQQLAMQPVAIQPAQPQPQPQVVMVQMPDGRMVPAQILRNAQPVQQYSAQPLQVQHQMNNYNNASAPPPYNANAKVNNIEQQTEGATSGDVYV